MKYTAHRTGTNHSYGQTFNLRADNPAGVVTSRKATEFGSRADAMFAAARWEAKFGHLHRAPNPVWTFEAVELPRNYYEVTLTVEVEAEDPEQAVTEARTLIDDEEAEVTVKDTAGLEVLRGEYYDYR